MENEKVNKPLHTFENDEGTIVSLIKPFSSSTSSIILSLSIDKKVNIFNFKEYKLIKELCNDAAPTKLFLLNKLNNIIIPKWDNSFSLININELKDKNLEEKNFNFDNYIGHESWILDAIELKNNKKNFITCGRDYTIQIWDLINKKCEKKLEGHSDNVNSIRELEENKIISSSSDLTLKIGIYLNTKNLK